MKNNQNKFEIKIALSLILLCLVFIGLLKGFKVAIIVITTICGVGAFNDAIKKAIEIIIKAGGTNEN